MCGIAVLFPSPHRGMYPPGFFLRSGEELGVPPSAPKVPRVYTFLRLPDLAGRACFGSIFDKGPDLATLLTLWGYGELVCPPPSPLPLGTGLVFLPPRG